ncbi:MAG: S1C family serine protease [Armatimonadota bacterium]
MDVLLSISQGLAGIVEAIGPSVVRVEARARVPASGIAWSADGTVVTADHGVDREEGIQVGLSDGRVLPAHLIGRDPTTDIAVLRVEEGGLTPPEWVEASSIQVGHLGVALARPGRSVRANLGIVSAVGEAWRTPAGGEVARYVEVDVSMQAGFSGGPLASVGGKVLGLNTTGLLRRRVVTVPAATLRRVVETLLAHGRIPKGYLGIGAQPVRLPADLAGRLGQRTGLMVLSVEAGSPGEHGGLHLGDVVVSVEGSPVRHLEDLLIVLSADKIGSSMNVSLIRAGQLQTVAVTVGERASS